MAADYIEVGTAELKGQITCKDVALELGRDSPTAVQVKWNT